MEISKLAISSIAWQQIQEKKVAQLLQKSGVSNVEVSPTKLWPEKISINPDLVTNKEIKEFMEFWKSYDIATVAMQSMLYLRPDLHLLDLDTNKQTIEYLKEFIVLASKMGVKKMIFGSPKNRLLDLKKSYEENYDLAVNSFKEIGDFSSNNGVIFCIEPNPEAYGCNFITNAKQGRDIVNDVASSGFKLHLDAAGMTLAQDNIKDEIVKSKDVLCHFHISEPYLNPVENSKLVDHKLISESLSAINYSQNISIEMKPATQDEDNLLHVESAIALAKNDYLTATI